MELGSEYNLKLSGLNIVSDNFFSFIMNYKYVLLDSGRSAIKLIKTKQGKILFPEYICESVITCFNLEDILFYRIRPDFSIDETDLFDKLGEEVKAVLVVHYFGAQQPQETLNKLRLKADEQNILIIEDTTQSLFSIKKTVGDQMVASVRKWMPIPGGGVLYSSRKLPKHKELKVSLDNERTYAMVLKDLFLEERLDCNTLYREIFEGCEGRLDRQKEIYLISDFSKFIMACVSITEIIRKRRENYEYLKIRLADLKMQPAVLLKEGDVPFAFPIRVTQRDRFRQYLLESKIYCAVHWPYFGEKMEERKQAALNADTLLSLPIDQRYGQKDMDYMIDVIAGYGGDFYFKSI